ncbi:uncharacterized protein LOC120356971 [Solenopsis invicta]|uniref:uncharacterized protein LOC120356971 n=1 Tax=Solenopsis invicta TaxID=13686 RepID=UPI00193DE5F6|nr:uncharacterized protein LOC120356971 [Solenopsis invicta]
MAEMEIPKKVYTCGMCEIILEEDTHAHECLKNYPTIVSDENLYLYPQCEDGSIVRRSAIDEDDQDGVLVMESHPPTDQEPLTSNTEQNVDEIIIAEVSARPLLWNQRINITKRDRRTVQQLWMEVADATNGECSVDDVKKKWKNLRDRFMKIVSLEKLPSGSGSKPSRKKWQYYDSMSFLRDTYLQKQTVSNITINESIDLINDAQEAHGDVEAQDEEVNDANRG